MWEHPERHPGEYLRRRFLDPLRLSASALARGLGIPRSRLSELLSGKRAITADTALRLGRYFRMEPEFWLALQASWDLAACEEPSIAPADIKGFLVGPAGAIALPERRKEVPDAVRVDPELLARLRQAASGAPSAAERKLTHVRYPDGQQAFVSEPK